MAAISNFNQLDSFGPRPNSSFLDLKTRILTPQPATSKLENYLDLDALEHFYPQQDSPVDGIRRLNSNNSQQNIHANQVNHLRPISSLSTSNNQILRQNARAQSRVELQDLQAHKLLQFVSKNDTVRVDKFCLYRRRFVLRRIWSSQNYYQNK